VGSCFAASGGIVFAVEKNSRKEFYEIKALEEEKDVYPMDGTGRRGARG
jgi:hypothetical protein